MTELRLTDPDGYTVPGSVRDTTPATEAQDREALAQLAAESIAQWSAWGVTYHARDYRVVTWPTT
ncbi:hypothetical protein P1P75_40645 [Streptomyces sp. ID05-39B]|uniref:hypothetical protein n=1 Tax=Streptomyces sp. ID05-39B TaxID=3028664 RepID=UPI0029BFA341|nr:hypothetical protein [Streptomyces sp. ID05-39B]MDX3532540.1 hypothetical protein [Streptomyces sp. ID05-39B]